MDEQQEQTLEQSQVTDGQKLLAEPRADKPWLFKPGQSGNPKGRPKDSDRKTVARIVKELPQERNERIAEALIRKAEAGEIRHIERIMDEQEGGALPQRRIPTSPNPDFEELTIQIREATLKTLKLRAPVEQEQDATHGPLPLRP